MGDFYYTSAIYQQFFSPKVKRDDEMKIFRVKSRPLFILHVSVDFSNVFITAALLPLGQGTARDHRCWGESDGRPQFIIHTPVTADRAEIWQGKHEP